MIGRPIEHSLSPVIHNAAFAAVGLDWTYRAYDVGEDEVAGFLARAAADGFGGLNVTMPDKAAAAAAVDRLSDDAAALGAVNTVVFDDEIVGHNTDGPGFLDALAAEVPTFTVAGSRCVVIGAGGAARAVVLALGRAAAAEVVVVNRTPSRATEAVALAPSVARVGEAGEVGRADLVVNATPVGMGGGAGAGGGVLPVAPDLLGPHQVVCDLIYWPSETPLLAAAAERGATAVNGLGMLVHQAARSFRLWTGIEPPVDVMTRAVRDELSRRG